MTAMRVLRSAPVLLLVLVAALPLLAATPKPASTPKIDPRATDLLRQMTDYLSGLQTFSVHVDTTRDLMLPSNEALSSDMSYDLIVRRPNELRIDLTSAQGRTEVFYNGKNLTVYTPAKNYYAVQPAPPTIDQTIAAAMRRGISMPLADLVYRDAGKRLLANITSATFVGSSMVGNAMTNQLAFRQKGVDWQIWIENSPTPLPLKLMIIDRRQKDYPRFVATLSNWNTDPVVDQSTFTFVPPTGAQKIGFGQLPIQPLPRTRPAPAR